MKMCFAKLNSETCIDMFLKDLKVLRVNITDGTHMSLRQNESYRFRIQTILGKGIEFETYYVGLGVRFSEKEFNDIFEIEEVWEI